MAVRRAALAEMVALLPWHPDVVATAVALTARVVLAALALCRPVLAATAAVYPALGVAGGLCSSMPVEAAPVTVVLPAMAVLAAHAPWMVVSAVRAGLAPTVAVQVVPPPYAAGRAGRRRARGRPALVVSSTSVVELGPIAQQRLAQRLARVGRRLCTAVTAAML